MYCTKSSCIRKLLCVSTSGMLVLRLSICCAMVASQYIIDTRYQINDVLVLDFMKLCDHKPMNNPVGYSLCELALHDQTAHL